MRLVKREPHFLASRWSTITMFARHIHPALAREGRGAWLTGWPIPHLAALPVSGLMASCNECSPSQQAWHMPTLQRLPLSFASSSGLHYCTSQSISDLDSFIMFTCRMYISYAWLPPKVQSLHLGRQTNCIFPKTPEIQGLCQPPCY